MFLFNYTLVLIEYLINGEIFNAMRNVLKFLCFRRDRTNFVGLFLDLRCLATAETNAYDNDNNDDATKDTAHNNTDKAAVY